MTPRMLSLTDCQNDVKEVKHNRVIVFTERICTCSRNGFCQPKRREKNIYGPKRLKATICIKVSSSSRIIPLKTLFFFHFLGSVDLLILTLPLGLFLRGRLPTISPSLLTLQIFNWVVCAWYVYGQMYELHYLFYGFVVHHELASERFFNDCHATLPGLSDGWIECLNPVPSLDKGGRVPRRS